MTMAPYDLHQWMIRIGKLRGKNRITEREAEELLGWTRESLRQRLTGKKEVPRYIELACKFAEIVERAKAM